MCLCHSFSFLIPCEDQDVEVLLWVEVFTIRELRECGETSIKGFLDSTTTSFTTWNLYICLTQTMIFCLHYVFIPRINEHLKAWKEAWDKHPLRSEHNFTPEQLWTAGLQHVAGCMNNIAKEVFECMEEVSLHAT